MWFPTLQSVNTLALCVKVIEKYLQSTHASTHSDYTMSVLDIFKLDREGESDSFLHLHNRSANTLGLSGPTVVPPDPLQLS